MARRYTEREEEAIWAMLCDGLGLTAVQRQLAADKAGLGYPREVPMSSLKDIRRRLIAAKGQPVKIVAPDDEDRSVSSARRRLVTILTSEADRLSRVYGRCAVLKPDEQRAAIALEKSLAEIEARKLKPAKSPRSKQGDVVKQGHETRKGDDPRSLAAIAQREREAEQEPASEDPLADIDEVA